MDKAPREPAIFHRDVWRWRQRAGESSPALEALAQQEWCGFGEPDFKVYRRWSNGRRAGCISHWERMGHAEYYRLIDANPKRQRRWERRRERYALLKCKRQNALPIHYACYCSKDELSTEGHRPHCQSYAARQDRIAERDREDRESHRHEVGGLI